ncbi:MULTISPECIES: ABC transporter permease [Dictyoglomus]|jgi:peptide/nickel transport system permease protein|uniref:Binding-protein-dependent transport systems inner membrane component n=1 Tax=Dictyoglomus turgidum (strain DSM 6724 / Z-1310) TaxID=515635 RepID=B8DYW0_DICTD|nr:MULTISPECIES: ABC transporter permease [Dictyoglomus]ACK41492.1 binding-protein-dependent transport systems inner membrane component [Dictyoglomus turgidum DSM 6724]PNV79356.1 MAG: ABC transporter permease [Dictyoglomus turgidum]HBU31881.1 ABC transporter permease [Dictyoglomus sp.]
MNFLKRYIIPRLIQYFIVIFIGITVVFLVPRLTPLDPVVTVLNRMTAYGAQYLDPSAIEKLKETMMELYGLKGNVLEQYLKFWGRLFKGDFGPSLSIFPTPVISIIMNSLPWTAGLLITVALLSWIIGNILGGLAGYYGDRNWAKILGLLAMTIYPIPYYIMALVLLILFAYVFPLFPMTGGYSVGLTPSFSLEFILNVLKHAFLPALSLILIGIGWWFLSMRSLTSTIVSDDYVVYAQIMGIPSRRILFQYVMRNALLPQITNLALQIGGIFSGSLITETVFSYPGLGQMLYMAINNGDYNLIMGIAVFSIVGIATAALLIDLLYPLFDPRVRYR